jgi:hypothetical protein
VLESRGGVCTAEKKRLCIAASALVARWGPALAAALGGVEGSERGEERRLEKSLHYCAPPPLFKSRSTRRNRKRCSAAVALSLAKGGSRTFWGAPRGKSEKKGDDVEEVAPPCGGKKEPKSRNQNKKKAKSRAHKVRGRAPQCARADKQRGNARIPPHLKTQSMLVKGSGPFGKRKGKERDF